MMILHNTIFYTKESESYHKVDQRRKMQNTINRIKELQESVLTMQAEQIELKKMFETDINFHLSLII